MSTIQLPGHFPRAKGCPEQASSLFKCLHEHSAHGVCSDSGSSRKMVVSEAISPTISPTLSPITSFSKFSPSNKWSPSRRERFDD